MAYQNTIPVFDRSNVAPYGKAGVALSVGDPVYLDSAGAYQKAVAVAAGTALASQTNAMYVVIKDTLIYESVEAVKFTILEGFTGLTIGAPVYLTATAGTISQTSPGIGYIQQIVGFAITATAVLINICGVAGDASKGVIIAQGTHVTTAATIQTITVAGITITDLAFVETCSKGAALKSVLAADTTTSAGFITATMSGDPSTDHKLAYFVIRPKA
jgi:hypothetical protein